MKQKGIKLVIFKILLERRIKLYERTGLLKPSKMENNNKQCHPDNNCVSCEAEPMEEMIKIEEEPKVYQK